MADLHIQTLHIQTTLPPGHDLASTTLWRSLREQTDDRWELATADDQTESLATVFIDSDASLHAEAVATILGAFERDPSVSGLIADALVAGVHRRRAGWSPTANLTAPTELTMLTVRSRLLRSGAGARPSGLAGRLWAAGCLSTATDTIVHVPAALSVHPDPLGIDQAAMEQLALLARSSSLGSGSAEGPRPGTFRLVPENRSAPVSIVIPSAGARAGDGSRLIEHCLEGLPAAGLRTLDVMVIVGDEYHGDPAELINDHRVRILRRPAGSFNFSAAINVGLTEATNELVLILNDDTEVTDQNWIDQLALHFDDPTVGAVGAALLYPDRTIQHLGVVLDDARPLHPFVGQTMDQVANNNADVAHDVIAVTGACMMLRRRSALAVGGFSATLPLSFNDVDFCMKLRRAGHRIVVDPAALLIHHESASREAEIEPWEWDRYIARWGEVIDPWYHPGHRRPDDPDKLRINADHLDPDEDYFDLRPRDTLLRPRVHHSRG